LKEQHHKWYSPNLGKDIEMSVFGHSGYPVIIFPTTMGRFYEAKDFKLIESAKWFVEQGMVTLYCPDSVNDLSWYNKGIHPAEKVKNHIYYDKAIMDELVERVRWNTPAGKVAVAGCSFGGYHAANFAFRHPELVSHMISMSGAFSITSFMDGYYDDNVYYNNPVDFLPNSNNPALWDMKIILGTSEWDICRPSNQELSNILNSKNIEHWYDERGWQEHDWPLWREMFPHYLSEM
jgi:esterase/lipase superfamily enzyme|tara:strand:+ start:172 stop:876 length:705 start_codon:yes stop_codon:yes gene_type:complete